MRTKLMSMKMMDTNENDTKRPTQHILSTFLPHALKADSKFAVEAAFPTLPFRLDFFQRREAYSNTAAVMNARHMLSHWSSNVVTFASGADCFYDCHDFFPKKLQLTSLSHRPGRRRRVQECQQSHAENGNAAGDRVKMDDKAEGSNEASAPLR